MTNGVFKAYEEGRKAPSLPELETLAYYLELPIYHFWSNEALSAAPARIADLDLPRLTGLRHRMIGALLRQERMNASLSMKSVAEQSGISSAPPSPAKAGQNFPSLTSKCVGLSSVGMSRASHSAVQSITRSIGTRGGPNNSTDREALLR